MLIIKKTTCNTTYSNALKLLKEKYNLKGRIIKTTNVVCEFIITSDKDFFKSIGEAETLRYFKTAYKFVANYQNQVVKNLFDFPIDRLKQLVDNFVRNFEK